ncbi:Cell shape-determining protein MreC [termite gut metagenome]|uniref:Cell shape-determining protein MreC n=1 Tax=termite gut metagenome TaxID=433724 RepID=A0A5J4SX17_9ZZZZ
MRHLFEFLIKYNYCFVFTLLEITAFVLLFRFNHYQRSVFLTSANEVAGKIYETSAGVTSYFNLRTANGELLERNMWLEQQLIALRKVLERNHTDSVKINILQASALKDYEILKANVINNSLHKVDNYITLNKGASDGIRPDMGVVGGNGIVGIVYKTSPNYSVVISILNSKSSISCKIKNSDYFGYLQWEPRDSRYAFLKDFPRHAEVNIGDTVITSGHSTMFPEGIIVGTVSEASDSKDALTYLLRVKLTTNFGTIDEVKVIARHEQNERMELEKNDVK